MSNGILFCVIYRYSWREFTTLDYIYKKGGANKKMITVIIKDKATQSYIGEIDVYKDELELLKSDFIVIAKQ